MKIIKKEGLVEIHNCNDFTPALVFGCGQCFRWDNEGVGIAGGKIARVVREDNITKIYCNPDDFDTFWSDYFDLSLNYDEVINSFNNSNQMQEAINFGRGIRILKQEPWEALVSFIISQCNNIPRIRGIIERMCALFGNEVTFGDIKRNSFPDAERIASLTLEDLEPLRSGYRAKYILDAARRIANGEVDLYEIAKLPTRDAREKLLEFEGVGNKVADCTLLFGMGKLDAYPVDVWMKRAQKDFFEDTTPDFGRYAGVAQQYIFHYIRNRG